MFMELACIVYFGEVFKDKAYSVYVIQGICCDRETGINCVY